MSDFTDFFPVSGGSGVGSGIPINGYFPFIVSATGNPTGYDSTTGLYTHPDGTFWIKSGNVIKGDDYPDANVGGYQLDGTVATLGTNGTRGGEFKDGDLYVCNGTANIYRYTTAGVLVATISLQAGTVANDIAWDGTNWWVANGTSFAQRYSEATANVFTFVDTGNIQTPIGQGNLEGLGYDGTSIIAQFVTDKRVWYINNTFGYGGTTYGPSGATASHLNKRGAAFDGTNYMVGRTVSPWEVSTFDRSANNIVYAGPGAGNTAINGVMSEGFSQTAFWATNNANPGTWYRYSKAAGDSTARTDTDSAQPLFVRLK
jgi:hypothetical protein